MKYNWEAILKEKKKLSDEMLRLLEKSRKEIGFRDKNDKTNN